MMDYRIPKPESLSGYAVHRMVAGLLGGAPGLHVDNGDHVLVRCDTPLGSDGRPVCAPLVDALHGFELKASVAIRVAGKNRYPDLHDWHARRAWLQAQADKQGFALLAVHVQGDRQTVEASNGRRFWIDATRFTGVLKVTDSSAFALALAQGIGRVGKAFGMGMLVI